MLNEDFLTWFDTLEVLETKSIEKRSETGKGFKRQRTPGILPVLGPNQHMRRKKAGRKKGKEAPLPRVATLRKPSKPKLVNLDDASCEHQLDLLQTYSYSNNDPTPGLTMLATLHEISDLPILPTLLFLQDSILWFGPNDDRGTFSTVQELSKAYKRIVIGLKHFYHRPSKSTQPATIATYSTESTSRVEDVETSEDLLSLLEKLCKVRS